LLACACWQALDHVAELAGDLMLGNLLAGDLLAGDLLAGDLLAAI